MKLKAPVIKLIVKTILPALLFALAVADKARCGEANESSQDKSERRTFSIPAGALRADFHVALDGKDTHPGTANLPFATLARARDEVRKKVVAGLTNPVVVLIRGGTYPQAGTLVFSPEDSGTEKHPITYASYPGERVVLSGGRRITGWKKGEGGIWRVELPEVQKGKWHFRQLFVNGRRAVRARTPNFDDPIPWWKIRTSTCAIDALPPEDAPITAGVTGPIKAYKSPRDVELAYIENNAGSRKCLGTVNETAQTFTLSPPHQWNPRSFGTEWKLSVPSEGKACYLENALEMLDQPGEWYLDRQTGVLFYWPRSGEDLVRDDVVAAVVQKTLLAVLGTRDRPVVNLHFKGIHVEHVEWAPQPWGYMGMFCCNVAVGKDPKPGHRFTEAAVEYEYARACSFVDGGIAHVGAMGLCLRNGTAHNVIEGNHIWDLGGGGIGAGYANVAYGYLEAAPPPEGNEYKTYRISNNYVHHCGMVDYGAVGICLFSSQDSVVAHNLIHDTAYFGIGVAGSQDPKVPFARNNTIEYNHIHNAMKVTVDGAGMYVTFAQADGGCLIRGNLLNDIVPNRFNSRSVGPYSATGLYLDGSNSGCCYENNVVYQATSALFVNGRGQVTWLDNLFQKSGTPPREFIEAMEAYAGLAPAYRRVLLGTEPPPCDYYPLTDHSSAANVWAACQFDRPQSGAGVVTVFRRAGSEDESVRLKLRGLDAAVTYTFKVWLGALERGEPELLAEVRALPGAAPVLGEDNLRVSGRRLLEEGLRVRLTERPQVAWIIYQRVGREE